MRRVGPIGLLLLAAAAWGSATTLSDFALRELPAIDLLALELTVGAVVVAGPVLARNRDALGTPGRGGFLLLGLFEPGLTFLLGNEGLRRASAATGSLLLATEVVFVAVLAFAFLGERPRPRTVLALALGLIGTVAVASSADAGVDTPAGVALMIASSLTAATYVILARRAGGRAPAAIVTSLQLIAALAFALPLVVGVHLAGHDPLPAAGPGYWLAGTAAGLLGVALPFLLYNRAIAAVPAASAAGLLALIPLVGLATAVAFLGDRPAIGELIGGALILLSIVWIGTLTAGARNDAARPVPSAPPAPRPSGSPAICADAHS